MCKAHYPSICLNFIVFALLFSTNFRIFDLLQNRVNLGAHAEVSDQNFVDTDPEAENLSRSIRRKRAKK